MEPIERAKTIQLKAKTNSKVIFTFSGSKITEARAKITVEVANWTAVPAKNGISAPPFFCSKYPIVVPSRAITQQTMPRVEKPVDKSPSSNFGESKKSIQTNPSSNPKTWRYESFSPSNGIARTDTKIGCKLTITAVMPAGISIKTA